MKRSTWLFWHLAEFPKAGRAQQPEPTIAAWEIAQSDAEATDPFRLDAFPGIKGTTSELWTDDRSVAIYRASPFAD